MLTVNNTLFSSQSALNGAWRNINNFIGFSIHLTGIEGNVWIEAANDPNITTDGANISAPPAPILSQYTPTTDSHKAGIATTTTYYVKNTYVTPNSLSSGSGIPILGTLGETTPSSETSLTVTAGNLLMVQSPAIATSAVGWNTYISTTSGAEQLQNFETNATVAQIPFGRSFILFNGLLNSNIVVPSSNTSSGPGAGINISSNLAAGTYAAPTPAAYFNQLQVIVNGTQAMVNPSSLVYNYIRVCKDSTANTRVTTAWLFGQIA